MSKLQLMADIAVTERNIDAVLSERSETLDAFADLFNKLGKLQRLRDKEAEIRFWIRFEYYCRYGNFPED